MRAGVTAASTPVWTSRDAWLGALRSWAHSGALSALCAAERVSITAATLLAVATVMAEHADHATGRHVAITRATIANRVGCDVRTVTAAWRVLRAAHWAVEAQRGHGSPGTPSAGRRPSVYHLVPRRRPAKPVQHFHLPPLGGSSSLSPVRNHSPSAHTRPQKTPSTTPQPRSQGRTPRPLPLQRLAAQLAARCQGLHRGHIGQLCDALVSAGIDPNIWTAQQITDALDADMRATGWTWPNHITRPGAFLATRLRRLTWSPQGPPTSGGCAAARPDKQAIPPPPPPPAYVPRPPVVLTNAQRQRRRHQVADALAVARKRRAEKAAAAAERAPRSAPAAAESTPVVCAICGGPGPVRRPWLPTRRANLCDQCWHAFMAPSAPTADQSPAAG